MNEKRRLVLNTLANGSSQVVAMLASLVFMPLLIEAFGLEHYGIYMLATSVSAYAVLLDLGIGAALTTLVAEHHAKKNRSALVGAASTATVIYAGIGVVAAIAMALVGVYAGRIFDVSPADAELLKDMLLVGALFQLWYWPSSAARYILGGLQRYDVLAASSVASTVLSIGATWYVIVSGSGPLMLVVLNGVVMVVVSAGNLIASRVLAGLPSVRFQGVGRASARSIFTFSWAVFVVQLSDLLFYQQTDRLLLGVFMGGTAVALYEAASKFNALITYISGMSVSAVLPLASSMGAQGREASLRSLLTRGTKYVTALIAPITVVTMVFVGPVIVLWLGDEFADQALVAQVLIFPHILMALGLVGDSIVISKGRLGRRVPYIAMQAVLNVGLSALLIPRIGILGVAIGTSVAHLVDFPFHMRFLAQETGLTWSDALRSIVLPVYPLLLVPAAVAGALVVSPLSDSLIGCLIGAGVSAAAYWLAFAGIGLGRDERADLITSVAVWRKRKRVLRDS